MAGLVRATPRVTERGIAQDGRTSSMKPEAIALAITCFICFEFEDLTESFICLVPEEFAALSAIAPSKHPAINSRLVQDSFVSVLSE